MSRLFWQGTSVQNLRRFTVDFGICNLANNVDTEKTAPLIAFANRLHPDRVPQNVGPNLDPDCLTQMVFLNLKKKSADGPKPCKVTQHAKSSKI